MGSMEYMLRLLRAVNRIHRCYLHPLPTAITADKPRWKLRELESDGHFRCCCPISSSARMFRNWVSIKHYTTHFKLLSTLTVHFLLTHTYNTMTSFYLFHTSSFSPIPSQFSNSLVYPNRSLGCSWSNVPHCYLRFHTLLPNHITHFFTS